MHLRFGIPLGVVESASSVARLALKDLMSNSRRCSRALSFHVYRVETENKMLTKWDFDMQFIRAKTKECL